MKRRAVLRLMAGGGVASVLGGCSELFPASFRARITVEVETPEGLRTGSSVWEIYGSLPTFTLPDSHKFNLWMKGEAVAVDLPGGQTLFALLNALDSPSGLWTEAAVLWAFEPGAQGSPGRNMSAVRKLGHWWNRGTKVEWPRTVRNPTYDNGVPVREPWPNYPRLVRFRDIKDPMTIERVDPNDLAKSFGPGIRLKRIMIETTGDGVTRGIERRLPAAFWAKWTQIHEAQLHNGQSIVDNPYFQTLAGKTGHFDFSTEILR